MILYSERCSWHWYCKVISKQSKKRLEDIGYITFHVYTFQKKMLARYARNCFSLGYNLQIARDNKI